MTTGSTSSIRESFAEDLLRKSMSVSKVAAQLRLDMRCWCTSEAYKYSISAIVMAAAMTSCSSPILGIGRFTSAFAGNVYDLHFSSIIQHSCMENKCSSCP